MSKTGKMLSESLPLISLAEYKLDMCWKLPRL